MLLLRLITFILLISFTTTCQGDVASVLITKELKPTPYLIKLLELDGLYDKEDSLKEIVEKTQKQWIGVRQGAGNKERIDLVDSPKWQSIKDEVVHLTRQAGLFDAQKPTRMRYDYGICLGAFLDGVRMRLAELIKLWESGVHFDSLVFLTGERTLRKEAGEPDDFAVLCDESRSPVPFKANWLPPENAVYETEYDMICLVWDQVQLPESMEKALKDKVLIVNAPRGKASRPSTKDTFRAWLTQHSPASGTIVTFSYPLIWAYQHLTAHYFLGERYPIETLAGEVSPELLRHYDPAIVSLIFDTIAKCLYEIEKGG